MKNNWTMEETAVAVKLYCEIPFSKVSKNNIKIVEVSRKIGRTPSSLSMKIGNIGRLDPELKIKGISGLKNGAKLEQEVWNEFKANPDSFSFKVETFLDKCANNTDNRLNNLPLGGEKNVLTMQRVNQDFFRNAVLSAYNYSCCISGLGICELLEACHIIEWSDNVQNRTNPKNGLCMNSLFHKAYDKNFIGISPDYKIIISDRMMDESSDKFREFLKSLNGQKIKMPYRFLPEKDFLKIKYDKFCARC